MTTNVLVTRYGHTQVALIVFAVALAVRLAVLLLQANAAIEMDGAEYVRIAVNLRDGVGYVGMRGVPSVVFPPLFPLLIAAVASLRVIAPDHAGAFVAAVAGAGLAAFVYLLTREMYDGSVALVVAAFSIVLPLWVDLSTRALSETTYACFVAMGLLLLLRAFRLRRSGLAAGAGGAFALATCTRPDGLILCTLTALAFALCGITRPGFRKLAAVSAAACFAILIPYVGFLYVLTGHMGLESKSALNFAVGSALRTGASYLSVANTVDSEGRPVGFEIDPRWYDARAVRPAGPPLRERVSLAAGALIRHIRDVASVFSGRDGGFGLLLVLALAGLIVSPWNDDRRRNELIMIGAAIAFYLPLAAVWHFWERFACLLLVPVVVWAAKGTFELAAWSRTSRLPNVGSVVAVAVLGASIAVDVANARHIPEPAPDRVAGKWLAEHLHPARVVDISDRIAYYAGASWSPLPYGSVRAVERYLDRERPDVVVINTGRISEYPPLAVWFESAPPASDAQLVLSVPSGAGELRLYRWGAHPTPARAVRPFVAPLHRKTNPMKKHSVC